MQYDQFGSTRHHIPWIITKTKYSSLVLYIGIDENRGNKLI